MSENIAESSPRDDVFSETETRLIQKVILRFLPILTIALVIAFIGPSLMSWLKATAGTFTVLAALTAVSAVLSLVLARRLPPG